jgi:prephenate dehydrogenase
VRVDADAHDQALARTSHLPYVVSRGLRELGAEAAAAGLSGPAFRDMTRVAGSDRRMAGAYVKANAKEVRRAWKELRATIDRMVGELETEE